MSDLLAIIAVLLFFAFGGSLGMAVNEDGPRWFVVAVCCALVGFGFLAAAEATQ